MDTFKRVLIVSTAIIIFWISNFIVNTLALNVLLETRDLDVTIYLLATSTALISGISFSIYRIFIDKWWVIRTIIAFLFTLVLIYSAIGLSYKGSVPIIDFYGEGLTDIYINTCASIVFLLVCGIGILLIYKNLTYNGYRAIEIAKMSYYKDTDTFISDYMIDAAQEADAEKIIGWSTKKFSKEIYLTYYVYRYKGTKFDTCFEVNLDTQNTREVSSDARLRNYYSNRKMLFGQKQ